MPPLIVISDPAANLLSVYFNTFAPDLQPPPPRKTPFFASENRECARPLPPPFTPQSSVPANSVPLSEKPFVCLMCFRTAKILFLHPTGKTIVRPYLRRPLLNLCNRDKRGVMEKLRQTVRQPLLNLCTRDKREGMEKPRQTVRQPLLNLCNRDKREPERIGGTKRGELSSRAGNQALVPSPFAAAPRARFSGLSLAKIRIRNASAARRGELSSRAGNQVLVPSPFAAAPRTRFSGLSLAKTHSPKGFWRLPPRLLK